nr:MAG TPA: 54S ribosomal protein [Caudoviricetes sp.]
MKKSIDKLHKLWYNTHNKTKQEGGRPCFGRK